MTIDKIKEIVPAGFEIHKSEFEKTQVYLYQKSGENTVAKFLIDFNDDKSIGNIQDYQEKYIAKDYFNSDNYLQWNYYLIFLRNNFSPKERIEIEKDQTYARKYVFDENQLRDFLEYDKSSSIEEEDVVGRWKIRLLEVDLQEVFSDEKYTEAIPRYINGKSKKLEELKSIDAEPDKSEDFILNEITELNLNSEYRNYPEIRDFNFRKVNLISGPNGVGKTSLMEGIELVITGRNARNKSANETPGSVQAFYATGGEIKKDIYRNAPGKYKARDYFWFNKSYSKFNSLYESFNRYNFYNTDSAYHLSTNSGKEINQHLSTIALGTEFGAIQDRLKGFKERLSKEEKNYKREIKQEKLNISDAQKSMGKLKEVNDPEKSFNHFLKVAENAKWKRSLPTVDGKKMEDFENDFQSAKPLINSLIHSKIESEDNVSNRLFELEDIKAKAGIIQTKLLSSREKSLNHSKNLNKIDSKIKVLERGLSFLSIPGATKIKSIQNDINVLETKITKSEKFLKEIGQVNIPDHISSSLVLPELILNLENSVESKTNRISESKEQLSILKTTVDKLKSLITEIKLKGKEYTELKDDIDMCPLCETPQTKIHFITKVQNSYNYEEDLVSLEKFNNTINRLQSEVSNLSVQLHSLKSIQNIISNYWGEEYKYRTVPEIKKLIEDFHVELAKDKDNLNELELLCSNLEIEGVNIETFTKLNESLSDLFPQIDLNQNDIQELQNLKSNEEDKLSFIRDQIKIEEELKNELDQQLENLLSTKYESKNFSQKIDFDIKELKNHLKGFEQLKEFIEIKSEDFVIQLRQILDRLNESFKFFQEQLKLSEELRFAKSLIEKSEERIKNLEPKYGRIKIGLNVIDNILETDNEDKVLNSFFRKNEKEISEIYSQIHAPKEFVNLKIENGEIFLYKIDGEKVSILEISTGQKSALALSIFLALNKKLKKGPDLIIFDDPVTYTDDLNILSFLDYLRNMVINESRQVIFATASNKIAALFEKKFKFLNDQFCHITLSRT